MPSNNDGMGEGHTGILTGAGQSRLPGPSCFYFRFLSSSPLQRHRYGNFVIPAMAGNPLPPGTSDFGIFNNRRRFKEVKTDESGGNGVVVIFEETFATGGARKLAVKKSRRSTDRRGLASEAEHMRVRA